MRRAAPQRRLAFAVAAGLLALSARAVRAESGRFELVWSAPPTCPSGEDVEQRVERILSAAAAAGGQTVVVSATVEEAGDDRPWRVRLETENGQRSLDAASCDELANATALFVAVLIEPNIDGTDAPDPPATPLAQPPAAAPLTTPARVDQGPNVDSADAAPDPAAARWAIGASTRGISGVLPAWSLGFGAHGAFGWKALRTRVGATYWLPAQQTIDSNANQGARFQLLSAEGKLCLQHGLERVVPGLCAGVQLSTLRGEGFGPGVEPAAQSANFASLSLGATLALRSWKELSLLVDVDALFPIGQRQFVFAGGDPALIHSPASGVLLSIGAEFAL